MSSIKAAIEELPAGCLVAIELIWECSNKQDWRNLGLAQMIDTKHQGALDAMGNFARSFSFDEASAELRFLETLLMYRNTLMFYESLNLSAAHVAAMQSK